jgi:hypothetical protein
MKTTIDMAREAGIDAEKDTLCRYEGWLEPLKAFEALVRADERGSKPHSLGPGEMGLSLRRELCKRAAHSITKGGAT